MTLFSDAPMQKLVDIRIAPPTSDTGWRPPAYLPNLYGARVIGLDTETKELDFGAGPGWARNAGHIVGISIAAVMHDGRRGRWYFPIRHELETEYNLDSKQVLAWLYDLFQHYKGPLAGANLMYDLGWLAEENIYPDCPLFDVQYAEALLDEDALVGLDHLGAKYCGTGKETDLLYEWLCMAYPKTPKSKQRGNIYRASPRLVGPYAEVDASLPIDIMEYQFPMLAEQGLLDVFYMECGLIPLLIKMRQQGVRVDLNKAEQQEHILTGRIQEEQTKLNNYSGFDVNINSGKQLAKAFDAQGIKYPRTKDGNPSFQKEWLTAHTSDLAGMIVGIRGLIKLRDTFIKSYILEKNVNGRVHCMFNSMRDDEGGTKTGRFSSSYPNLQNIPVRSKEGKQIRSIFVKDIDSRYWEKMDYSQIEYRMLAHYAVDGDVRDLRRLAAFWEGLLGHWGMNGAADKLRQSYIDNPKTDYHDLVQASILDLTGMQIDRRPVKNINFGLLYGQSEKGLASKAGFSPEQAKDIFRVYHLGAPYVKPTMKAISNMTQALGYTTTILGRRTRFNLWEPRQFDKRAKALPYEEALRYYGPGIERAYTYRAVNYRLQGSAAEVIKRAMLAAYRAGVFDVTGYPLLQVHDELDINVRDDSPAVNEAHRELRHILETALPCRIPIRVDHGRGDNWGEID